MRYFKTLLVFALLPLFSYGQFEPVEEEKLTIIVTDGTDTGKRSEGARPKSYSTVVPLPKKGANGKGGQSTKGGNKGAPALQFTDPILPLGMSHSIQAAAFIDRPQFGLGGFLLIFCVNDSIGDEQGDYEANGKKYKGVYRLIRQKFTPEEPIPEGMAAFKISGTIFILGSS